MTEEGLYGSFHFYGGTQFNTQDHRAPVVVEKGKIKP